MGRPNSVLIVCTGNICRSPIGERLLRSKLPGLKIDSAGTRAVPNHKADATAERIAKRYGVSLLRHQSRQLTPRISQEYELILVMEQSHISDITLIAPEARSKCFLLGHWINRLEIPDPWHKSEEAFEHVYQFIDQSCQSWISKLGG